KSNYSEQTSEGLQTRSSSYSVLQNYMHIPTKFLLSQVSLNLNYERNFETKHWMEAENLISVSAGYTF
ncbi:hypothetical protein, partial [Parabacteroides sp. An277]|uniref:hypothetical protein n=1 Tax=Parabacteroides sp. An277 TaxID=1965619 RepID=UPI0013A6526D